MHFFVLAYTHCGKLFCGGVVSLLISSSCEFVTTDFATIIISARESKEEDAY